MWAQLRRYRVAAAIGAAGLVVVLAAGLLFESGSAILVSGGIVGVLTGIAIAATHKDEDTRR